jgi:hydroxyacylglutathione hydrolase
MAETLAVDKLELGPYSVNCYILSDNGQAVIIDPGFDPATIENLIRDRKIDVKEIIITHGHVDHIMGLPRIKKFTGALVLIHQNDAVMLTDPKINLSAFYASPFFTDDADGFLDEGDIINIGRFQLKVIHTPGHSPGSISLLTEEMVFTGDTLFSGSIGGTDFPGADYQTLISSIKNKLLTLPGGTIVYPGHGPDTTIGKERTSNPWLT